MKSLRWKAKATVAAVLASAALIGWLDQKAFVSQPRRATATADPNDEKFQEIFFSPALNATNAEPRSPEQSDALQPNEQNKVDEHVGTTDAGMADDATISTLVLALDSDESPVPDDEITDVLLVGLDRSAHRLGGRADAIALVRIQSPRLAVVSIPRDLLVAVNDHPPKRINAIPRLARLHGLDPKQTLAGVVERLMKLSIEHVIFVQIGAVRSTIDALDGVVVDVPCPIDDNFIVSKDPMAYEALRVDAGPQTMNGRTAEMYMRSRHGRSDWDRQSRQHLVLSALQRKIREQSPLTILKIAGTTGDSIDSDMTRLDVLRLAQEVASIAPESTRFIRFSREMAKGTRLEDGRSVLLPDAEEIRDGVASAMTDSGSRHHRTKRCKDRDVALRHRK